MTNISNVLSTFHKDPINKQFVQEYFEQFVGQGLYKCGKTILIGNGYNRYFMKVKYLGKIGIIIFEEKHIEKWELRYTPEEKDEEEYDSFAFEGFGMLEGEYYDFKHFKNGENIGLCTKDEYDIITFEVLKIDVECYVSAPIKSRDMGDWINECRMDIQKTKADCLKSRNIIKVNYETFMKESGDYCLYDDTSIILEFTKIHSYSSNSQNSSDVIIGDHKCIMYHYDISDENSSDIIIKVVYKKFGQMKKLNQYCYIGKLSVDLSFEN